MRTPIEIKATIEAERRAFAQRLAKLQAERRAAVVARTDARRVALAPRNAEIVKAFDDGASRDDIAATLGVTYQVVANVLHKAGRSERQRRAKGMTPAQQADYRRLLRHLPSRAARNIALAVGGEEAAMPVPAHRAECREGVSP